MSDEIGLTFIEQLQKLSSENCTKETRPYLVGISEIENIALLTRPACKCWNCIACAARNTKRWIARIINHVNKSDAPGGWFMFTLTAHEKWRGTDASIKNLRQGWKKLYNRMRYEFGVSDYVKVWEMHKDDSFHLHGLIDTKLTKKWLKRNARETGMGYQVDISDVDNPGKIAGYISKYFLKSESNVNDKRQFPKNLRRIEVSRSWTKLPDLNADTMLEWFVQSTRDGQLARAQTYFERGFQMIDNARPTRSDKEIVKVLDIPNLPHGMAQIMAMSP